jgi:hypothetical protein
MGWPICAPASKKVTLPPTPAVAEVVVAVSVTVLPCAVLVPEDARVVVVAAGPGAVSLSNHHYNSGPRKRRGEHGAEDRVRLFSTARPADEKQACQRRTSYQVRPNLRVDHGHLRG